MLLPHLDLWSESFYEEHEVEAESSDQNEEDDDEEQNQVEMVWNEEGVSFGHRLLKCVIEIDRALKESIEITPAPDWTEDSVFELPKDASVREELLKVETQLEELDKRKGELKTDLIHHSSPKRLLYEKGKPLENAILDALSSIGFSASNYKDTESEFDVIFESPEGRFLGEAEGKDNKPINIEKLRQLEMNILEDFEKDEVDVMAKGTLFGNAYRLKKIDEREEFFTEKCQTAAKRSSTALIRTIDLFPIVQYLSGNNDKAFAKKCRKAILSANGEIVVFPEIPKKRELSSREKKE